MESVNELTVPKSNKLADWKAHAQECHKLISQLLMEKGELDVEKKDNEFHREQAVLTFHALEAPDYKKDWDNPHLAEIYVAVHTSKGTFYLNELDVHFFNGRPMVGMLSRKWDRGEGKRPKYFNAITGRAFEALVLENLDAGLSNGFNLAPRTYAERYTALKAMAPKKEETNEINTPDEAKDAIGG
jgi:hypothetical protein